MIGLSGGTGILYAGIGLMIFAVVMAIACVAVFKITDLKLKSKLEEEYGKPFIQNEKGNRRK